MCDVEEVASPSNDPLNVAEVASPLNLMSNRACVAESVLSEVMSTDLVEHDRHKVPALAQSFILMEKPGIQLLQFKARIGTCSANATVLVDSGATHNFVASSFVEGHRLAVRMLDDGPLVSLADGTMYRCHQVLQNAKFCIQEYHDVVSFLVVPLVGRDLLLGHTWLQDKNPKIDWQARTLNFGPYCLRALKLEAPSVLNMISALQVDRALDKGAYGFMCLVTACRSSQPSSVESPQTFEIEDIVQEFTDLFQGPQHCPPPREVDHKIELEPGVSPPFRPVYRMSLEELSELRRQLDELLAKKFIRPSKSPFGAPVLFVRK